ncbi:peptidase [Catellatospora sp. TT07R-123]|uniref:Clp protease N-terminal domain-containing protein n=1 Tax=Catellatospora sp. TT07R-123 TaxID=2733863 RepID=UPI001B1EB1E6|nr:Clp protease N-terminal domain-containing protein [Catellatospora sp. TT07R-123]GHJ47050.1 peptidase [Catellatospora sp. TT07R-123]
MFRGDHPDLRRTVNGAMAAASRLGHPRTGSEHLLLALTTLGSTVSAVLARHGATEAAIAGAVHQAAPLGAGAAADRDALAPLGIDLTQILSRLSPTALDRAPAREPLLPLGAAKARRRCARMNPRLGLDAQAAYEASLRLALARRERGHRAEHLALCLVALDPGASWVLRTIGVDTSALLMDLANTFPPPKRNVLLRIERRIGLRPRRDNLIARYQRTTGRAVTSGASSAPLIVT